MTSGLRNERLRHQRAEHQPARAGAAHRSRVTGFFTLGDAQQPFVKRVNDVSSAHRRLDAGSRGRTRAEVRRRRAPGAHADRVHQPAQRRPDLQRRAAPAMPPRTSCSDCRRSPGRTHDQPGAGRHRLAVRRLCAGRVAARSAALTLNAGLRYELAQPFVDSHDALNAFHPGVQSTRFPAAPAGLVYPGDPGVPRGTYTTDTNNLAPATRRRVGSFPGRRDDDRSRRMGRVLRRARRTGRLLPERRARAAVHAAGRSQLAAGRRSRFERSAERSSTGGATPFPPDLTIIGWGPTSRRRTRSTSTPTSSARSAATSPSRRATSARAERTCRCSSR